MPGIEEVEDGVYRRTAQRAGRPGVVTVNPNDPGPDERARLVLGLDQDTERIDAALAADALLAPLVEARPGLRVPGAWDGFELAVRAVLGQQVSVAAGRGLAERLALRHGEPLAEPEGGLVRLFPAAERLADLLELPGIGPWTVEYVAMRALRDPDAFPASDLVLRNALGGISEREALARAEAWRPWRAYAAMHLWTATAAPNP